MKRLGLRLAVPIIGALVALGPLAGAAAAWNDSCNSGEACVWLHAPREVPLAAQAADDSNYGNNVYPNTTITLHDSVSSIQNKKSNAVIWFFNYWSGTAYCLPAGWYAEYLNSHNDQYDSHLTASAASCS